MIANNSCRLAASIHVLASSRVTRKCYRSNTRNPVTKYRHAMCSKHVSCVDPCTLYARTSWECHDPRPPPRTYTQILAERRAQGVPEDQRKLWSKWQRQAERLADETAERQETLERQRAGQGALSYGKARSRAKEELKQGKTPWQATGRGMHSVK